MNKLKITKSDVCALHMSIQQKFKKGDKQICTGYFSTYEPQDFVKLIIIYMNLACGLVIIN